MRSLLRKLFGPKPYDPFWTAPFPRLTRAWARRLKTWPRAKPEKQNGSTVAILVTPWLGTAVPFFNFEIALELAAAGQRVTILWDDTDLIGNAPHRSEAAAIAETLTWLPDWIKVIAVSEQPFDDGAPSPVDEDWIADWLFQNGVWRMRGESNAPSYVKRKEVFIPQIHSHAARVYSILKNGGWGQVLIPGGVWGLSGLYVSLAEKMGCPFVTYDCGALSLTICHQGVACHQIDIPLAAELVQRDVTADRRDRMRMRAWNELKERMAGRGNYDTFQARAAGGETFDFDVLVPLNQRWDTAALGRQRLFPTVEDWLVALLRWAEAEPTVRLCVRQHPCERQKDWRSTDDIRELFLRENRAGERVRFIGGEEPISTYDLLRTTKVVSPYTSSVGLEAGMLGVPVVVSAKCYYERASFVWRPETPAEYFSLLKRGIEGDLVPSERASADAALFYHLVQECNIVPSPFGAAPFEYLRWVKMPPENLWVEPSCIDLRESLLSGKPLSFLQASRLSAPGPGV